MLSASRIHEVKHEQVSEKRRPSDEKRDVTSRGGDHGDSTIFERAMATGLICDDQNILHYSLVLRWVVPFSIRAGK